MTNSTCRMTGEMDVCSRLWTTVRDCNRLEHFGFGFGFRLSDNPGLQPAKLRCVRIHHVNNEYRRDSVRTAGQSGKHVWRAYCPHPACAGRRGPSSLQRCPVARLLCAHRAATRIYQLAHTFGCSQCWDERTRAAILTRSHSPPHLQRPVRQSRHPLFCSQDCEPRPISPVQEVRPAAPQWTMHGEQHILRNGPSLAWFRAAKSWWKGGQSDESL